MGAARELSARLRAIADLVTEGYAVCDVGCDHGFVPIALVREGKAPCALASDINAGPLLRASRKNWRRNCPRPPRSSSQEWEGR